MVKTAILVDGGFYRRRSQILWGDKTAEKRADELQWYCMKHIKQHKTEDRSLYRVFYYDCPPMDKKVYHPFLKKQIDFGKTELYLWATKFFDRLRGKRKFALRLGKLAEAQAQYSIKYDVLKKLCNGVKQFSDLSESDFFIDVDQKGVDMKIGLDIASLAHKKQVDQIILISGDSDFVPAAKHARREGIDFILDNMRHPIKPDLFEHIDGIQTFCPKQ